MPVRRAIHSRSPIFADVSRFCHIGKTLLTAWAILLASDMSNQALSNVYRLPLLL